MLQNIIKTGQVLQLSVFTKINIIWFNLFDILSTFYSEDRTTKFWQLPTKKSTSLRIYNFFGIAGAARGHCILKS